jgi:hypothetical protein
MPLSHHDRTGALRDGLSRELRNGKILSSIRPPRFVDLRNRSPRRLNDDLVTASILRIVVKYATPRLVRQIRPLDEFASVAATWRAVLAAEGAVSGVCARVFRLRLAWLRGCRRPELAERRVPDGDREAERSSVGGRKMARDKAGG